MDLWYYFVHRGLELLKPASLLSFIVNAYWTAGTGAEKLISTLRETSHIDEIFSFGKLKVFQKVSGQHMVIRVTNATSSEPTTIKLAESSTQETAEPFVSGVIPPLVFTKRSDQLFLEGKVDIQPSSDGFLSKLGHWAPLTSLGIVRQGIAENPASINRKPTRSMGIVLRSVRVCLRYARMKLRVFACQSVSESCSRTMTCVMLTATILRPTFAEPDLFDPSHLPEHPRIPHVMQAPEQIPTNNGCEARDTEGHESLVASSLAAQRRHLEVGQSLVCADGETASLRTGHSPSICAV